MLSRAGGRIAGDLLSPGRGDTLRVGLVGDRRLRASGELSRRALAILVQASELGGFASLVPARRISRRAQFGAGRRGGGFAPSLGAGRLALPEIVQFRTRHFEPPADAQTVGQALLDIILKLRELCAKEQPAYAVRDHLDATESRAVGTELVEQAAQSEATTGDETMASLHEKWRIEPQPFQSEAPIVGPGIAAFREAWISIATRWYVEPLITQQRAFNAVVTQALDREVDKLNRVSVSQVELLHLVRQLSDNVERAQQENAQHVRELNTLLSELLRLRARVTELESENWKLNLPPDLRINESTRHLYDCREKLPGAGPLSDRLLPGTTSRWARFRAPCGSPGGIF